MQKVLQTLGGVITQGTGDKTFTLAKQGIAFNLKRVFLSFSNGITETVGWYFILIHVNGEDVEIGRSSTTVSEIPYTENCDERHAHFFADVEFRSHLDGIALNGGSGYSQLMTAPLGCEGWRIDTNDKLKLVCVSADTGGMTQNLTIGTIYWHCNFETPEKKE